MRKIFLKSIYLLSGMIGSYFQNQRLLPIYFLTRYNEDFNSRNSSQSFGLFSFQNQTAEPFSKRFDKKIESSALSQHIIHMCFLNLLY